VEWAEEVARACGERGRTGVRDLGEADEGAECLLAEWEERGADVFGVEGVAEGVFGLLEREHKMLRSLLKKACRSIASQAL